MNDHNLNILHLLNRAGFGPSPHTVRVFQELTIEQAVDKLFEDSAEYKPLQVTSFEKISLRGNLQRGDFQRRRKRNRLKSRGKQRLNFNWLMLMAHDKAQLKEKMAFFWHDHFACDVEHPVLTQNQINIFREHGLAYFGDLVVALSKDPAMIQYLNSRENVKNNPNENFGRELLELFTIGIGHYDEKDVQEAARAFTGYSYDDDANFILVDEKHDQGNKSFLGQQGFFKGDEIIDILLQQPETGRYITSKIYFFLAGSEALEKHLDDLSTYFYQSGYHIGKLLRKILTDDEFYRHALIGQKIKSPVELLAGLFRVTLSRPVGSSFTYVVQRKLRQQLLAPPNVAGWPQGKAWVDLSTIPERLKLAQLIMHEVVNVKTKNPPLSLEGDDPEPENVDQTVKIKMNLRPLRRITNHKSSIKRVQRTAAFLYTANFDHLTPLLESFGEQLDRSEITHKEIIANLLSLPEYQVH